MHFECSAQQIKQRFGNKNNGDGNGGNGDMLI